MGCPPDTPPSLLQTLVFCVGSVAETAESENVVLHFVSESVLIFDFFFFNLYTSFHPLTWLPTTLFIL